MPPRYFSEKRITGDDEERLSRFLSGLTGFDRDELAYVVITTRFTEEGQKVYANTGDVMQVMALLHTALLAMTAGSLGVPVSVPPG
jgi:hypothetical protein